MSEEIGQKHIDSNVRELGELVDLKYNKPKGGIFRLLKGKSPLLVTNIIQCEDIILIECMYLTSGSVKVYKDNKKVIPLKLGSFEDDDEFLSLNEQEEAKHLGCRNWPNCDTEGCGEW